MVFAAKNKMLFGPSVIKCAEVVVVADCPEPPDTVNMRGAMAGVMDSADNRVSLMVNKSSDGSMGSTLGNA